MKQFFKTLTILCLLVGVGWTQTPDNLFRIGVDYKSKIKMDSITANQKDAIQNFIKDSFSKTIGLTKAYNWSIDFSEVAQSQFEAILREQQSQEELSECTDSSCAITLGQLANAKYMVYRDLIELGRDRTQITLQLINIESGQSFYSTSELFEGNLLSSEGQQFFERLMVTLFNGAFIDQTPLPSNQKLINTQPTNLYPPEPVNQSITLVHSRPVTINLSAKDQDGDPVQFELVGQPEHGAARLNGKTIIYNPNRKYVGEDQILFRVTDGTYTVPGTINLTVTNLPPSGQSKRISVRQGEDVTFFVEITDPDQDNIEIELVSEPRKGRLRQSSKNAFRYTPIANVEGSDRFTYRVTDGISFSKPYNVDITIIKEQITINQPIISQEKEKKDGGPNMLLILGALLLLALLGGGGGSSGGGSGGGGSGTGTVDIGIEGP